MNTAIKKLVQYGIAKGLIEKEDAIYIINRLLELFHIEEYEDPGDIDEETDLEGILQEMLDYACDKGLIKENSTTYRDLFDTKIMGILVPRPGEVIHKFNELYRKSPKHATDYFYQFSMDTDYIRRYRIEKDIRWKAQTEYGELDISINLSKPEKDPKAIAAAKTAKQSGYPKCQLCKENEGYEGRIDHPARQNHRIIPIKINQQEWGFQYSPYVYYNEHCIVFNGKHTPMKVDKSTFIKLFDFIKQFPHYFLGSNADLPIVGGSILTHDHFQGGNYDFAMAKAAIEKPFMIDGFEDVESGILKWPMSVIRIRGKDEKRLIEAGSYILDSWRNYSDSSLFIYAYTNGEPHNTITPIARKVKDTYELDLVLRNNITTKEHPLGVFHPHEELHHIKKENIGLIEVMGCAILPSRLKEEIKLLEEYILTGKDIKDNDMIGKHYEWAEKVKLKHPDMNETNIREIIQNEIGNVFLKVLEHAGIYKRDKEGQEGFLRFIRALSK